MAQQLVMPKLGMTMTEGTLVEWLVADGAEVAAEQPLYRLTTEKLDHEELAPAPGRLVQLVGPDTTLECGAPIGWLLAPGEPVPGGAAPGEAAPATPPTEPATVGGPGATRPTRPAGPPGGRLLMTPLARATAAHRGVDLATVVGSGPGGRIVKADVDAAAAARDAAARDAAGREAAAVSGGGGSAVAGGDVEHLPVSPVARNLARALGVDLATVRGSGPGGRIVKEDVETAAAKASAAQPAAPAVPVPGPAPAPAPAPPPAAAPPGVSPVPLTPMRKIIAARMHDSLQRMAQLTLAAEVQADELIKLRTQLVAEWADEGVKPGYTDLVIKAAGKALRRHPGLNAQFGERSVDLLDDVHVGMAVAIDGPPGATGLLVPVIRHADRIGLKDLAVESSRLASAARAGKLTLAEMEGGTFSVTSLGAYGIDGFTPVVNPPNVAILGVGRIHDGLGWEGDRPVRRAVMTLSLTIDHRAVDGAPGAEFLATIRSLLEQPYRLLL